MNLYLAVLKAMLEKEIYEKYQSNIPELYLKENMPELFRLFKCLPSLHGGESSRIRASISDLEVAHKTLYPASNDEDYAPIFKQLQELDTDISKVQEYLKTCKQRDFANKVAITALSVSEGTKVFEDLQAVLQASQEILETDELETSDFEEASLDELEQSTHLIAGLRWRLGSLNRNLGSLRVGDFGFVFARPETGKTTFLASEVSHMATQTDAPILWFNNEEQGRKVLLRCNQGSLGVTLTELWGNKSENERRLSELKATNIKIVRDATITRRRVEELCKRYKPALIIFDQIDKIKGFKEDERQDVELKAIYVWAREIAKTYAPVIAVCQAGATGDGKRWLTMNDVDNSKTGKQGEADWILGIGKVYDDGLDGVRFLHLSKNKLLGDSDADESMRHGKWEVKIKPEIARYEDF